MRSDYRLLKIGLIFAGLFIRSNLQAYPATPTKPAKEASNLPNPYWIPLGSLLIPGLGQYIQGKIGLGITFTAIAHGGRIFASRAQSEINRYQDSWEYQALKDIEKEDYLIHGEAPRKFALGSQLTLAMGSFSAYENFVSRIEFHKPYGRFTFITHQDSLNDIIAAPFDFSHLKSLRSIIPLSIISGLYVLSLSSNDDTIVKDTLSSSDVVYAGSFSYLAGTHEEAFFRGYVLPSFSQAFDSPFWANMTTATIFGLAHLNTVDFPIAQLVLGWHLGNTAITNGFSLQESVFIHTWWDVIAFLAIFQFKQKNPDSQVQPVLNLPPLQYNF